MVDPVYAVCITARRAACVLPRPVLRRFGLGPAEAGREGGQGVGGGGGGGEGGRER